MTSFTDLNSVAHIDESSSMKRTEHRTERNRTEQNGKLKYGPKHVMYTHHTHTI